MRQKSYVSYTFLTIYEAAIYTIFYGIVLTGNILGVFNSGFGLENPFLAWLICDLSGIIIGLIFLLVNKVILSFLYVFKKINDRLEDIQESCGQLVSKPAESVTEAINKVIRKQIEEKAYSTQIIIPPKGKWICPVCGKKNPKSFKTCRHCFHELRAPHNEKMTWDCPECGNHNPYTVYSCRICNHIYRNSL